MISQVITCDVCGKQKQEVNHWWLWEIDMLTFIVRPWTETLMESMKHACGQECIVKAVNKFMQEQMSAVQDSKETTEAKA